MLSHEKASQFNSQPEAKSSKLLYPQNFVDPIRKDKPLRPKEPILVQPKDFIGKEAASR
jgi:Xaa-Pro aminopeptidase